MAERGCGVRGVARNHPGGDPTPSRADIQMTKAIVDIAKPLGISVHDHIIVGKEGHASMKGLGLILVCQLSGGKADMHTSTGTIAF